MVVSGSHTCLYCCVKSSHNRWITGSHESIYELLGTYMKESERYSLAPITELGEGKKKTKTPGFHELPQKNKQDFIEESTSHWVPVWQIEATVRRELR